MEEELIEEVVEGIIDDKPSFLTYLLPTLPPVTMSLLTLLLIAVLFCGWKAPRWVKPFGSIAVALSAIAWLWKFIGAFLDIKLAGALSPMVFMDGFQIMIILFLYGLLIFLVSRIIVLIQKERY
ncbi:MAG: hypothetical protein IKZ89_03025 [Bacteroidaceae bacterium]|nr:hypothetical protein [Bacteroidaceae bacterium]